MNTQALFLIKIMVLQLDFTVPTGDQFAEWCDGRGLAPIRIYDINRDTVVLGELNQDSTSLYDTGRAESYLTISAQKGSWRGVDVAYNELTNGDSRVFNSAMEVARGHPNLYGSDYVFPVADSYFVTRGNDRSDEQLIIKDTRLFGHQLKIEASANIFKCSNLNFCHFQQLYPVVSQHFLRTEIVGMKVVLPSSNQVELLLQKLALIFEFLVDFDSQSPRRQAAFAEVFPDASEDLLAFRGQFETVYAEFQEVSELYDRIRVLMSSICQKMGSWTLNRGRLTEFMQFSELMRPNSPHNFDKSLHEFVLPKCPQAVQVIRD